MLCICLGICAAPIRAQTLAPLNVEPNTSVDRTFGPATLTISVRRKTAQVLIGVRLQNRAVMERSLTPSQNTMKVDAVEGDVRIRGDLVGTLRYPDQQSILSGSFTVTQAGRAIPFRGDLAIWTWSSPLVFESQTVWLTPELSAVTDLLYDQRQTAQVRLITVGQAITTLSLAQGVNDAVVTQGFQIGTVTIDPGLSLHLQPATPLQTGAVYLTGGFSSSDHQGVRYSGAIATRPYVAPPPEVPDQ